MFSIQLIELQQVNKFEVSISSNFNNIHIIKSKGVHSIKTSLEKLSYSYPL